jgi:segregation and condensation protein A
MPDGHAPALAAEGRTPHLTLDGFNGPLADLLALARAREVDLGGLSLVALITQLAGALERAVPLGEKADWLVMAAWLLHLRSNLLLPADEPAQSVAETQADQLRSNLVALQHMQALSAWLDTRAQLGRDVFVRGQPEALGLSFTTAYAVNVVEFLWASLALFDDDSERPDTRVVYRPLAPELHAITAARARILRLLAGARAGRRLEELLPEPGDIGTEWPSIGASGARRKLRHISRWTSTFIASLELAKQGEVGLTQAAFFQPIHVTSTMVAGPST